MLLSFIHFFDVYNSQMSKCLYYFFQTEKWKSKWISCYLMNLLIMIFVLNQFFSLYFDNFFISLRTSRMNVTISRKISWKCFEFSHVRAIKFLQLYFILLIRMSNLIRRAVGWNDDISHLVQDNFLDTITGDWAQIFIIH